MPNPCGPWSDYPESFSRMSRSGSCGFLGVFFLAFFAAFFCEALSLQSAPCKIFGNVTNYPHPRTTPKPPKTKRASRSYRNALERCLKKPASGAAGLRNRRCLWSRPPRPANLADLKAHKPPDGNVLAKLRDRLRNHLADRDALVLDIVLLVKAVFLVKLLHLPRGNFLD